MAGKSKWGVGITVLYSGFALFMIAIVLYVSFVDFELVENDYYQKEMLFQNQVDKINNTNLLSTKLAWTMDTLAQQLIIVFPDAAGKQLQGNITFFRPSKASLDLSLPVRADSIGRQTIDISKMNKGLWVLKIDWSDSEKNYYWQDKLFIN